MTDEDDTVEGTESKFLIAICDFSVGGKGLNICNGSSSSSSSSGTSVAPNARVHVAMIAIDIECVVVTCDVGCVTRNAFCVACGV